MFGNFQRRVQDWYGRLKINAGKTKAPALEIAQTWNDASTTYTGIKAAINGTGTASASASDSLLMDLKLDNYSRLTVDKSGNLALGKYNDNSQTFKIGSNFYDKFHGWKTKADWLVATVEDSDLYGFGYEASRGFVLNQGYQIGWSAHSNNPTSGTRTSIIEEQESVIGQRTGTKSQTFNLYATYTSATSYHRLASTTAKTTLSAVSGATVTASALIPAGANLLGVTTRVNTALGTSNGTTGYAVGTATDPNLWGDVTAVAAGTASKAQAIVDQSTGYTADDALGFSVAAQDVVITAAGGNFDGTGAIEVCAFYSLAEAD